MVDGLRSLLARYCCDHGGPSIAVALKQTVLVPSMCFAGRLNKASHYPLQGPGPLDSEDIWQCLVA